MWGCSRKDVLRSRVSGLLLMGIIYLASYAPYLYFANGPATSSVFNPYYRSPTFYRGAEWFLIVTPARPVLMWWARCVGVEFATEMQVFYFASGITDPASQVHFNINYGR